MCGLRVRVITNGDSLAPLQYSDQHSFTPVLNAVSPVCGSAYVTVWTPISCVSGRRDCHPDPTCLRVIPEARRIWTQSCPPPVPLVGFPISRERWSACGWISSRPVPICVLSLFPHFFGRTAFADACTDSESVGLGGFLRLPDTRQLFFQSTFSRAQMLESFPGFRTIHHCSPSFPRGNWPPRKLCSSSPAT